MIGWIDESANFKLTPQSLDLDCGQAKEARLCLNRLCRCDDYGLCVLVAISCWSCCGGVMWLRCLWCWECDGGCGVLIVVLLWCDYGGVVLFVVLCGGGGPSPSPSSISPHSPSLQHCDKWPPDKPISKYLQGRTHHNMKYIKNSKWDFKEL